MSFANNEASQKSLCARLARVEGQLRGLQKLIQSDAEPEKVAQQMAAARKALDKAFFALGGSRVGEGATSKEDMDSLLVRFVGGAARPRAAPRLT